MANDGVHTAFARASRRRSCNECRTRRTRCELKSQPDGSMKCLWCIKYGKECDLPDDESLQQNTPRPPNDGSMIMNGQTSAHAGFQLSDQSFLPTEESREKILRIRQNITENNYQPWTDIEGTDKLYIDPPLAKYIENELFFAKVQPYIPIITRQYVKTNKISPLLRAAMYGVAARLNGVLVSSRDFVHIKQVLHAQLMRLMNNYKPSLQALMALTLIHLTVELQTEGIHDTEAWPIRLGMAVRMALELKLHRRSAQSKYSEDMQEMRRRLFWAVFIKDRWTSTGKGYPLMISYNDIDLDFPDVRNLDLGFENTKHHFFVELIQQAIVVGKCHSVAYRADRFTHVEKRDFREVQDSIAELENRLRRFQTICKDYDSQATLALNYAALKLIFYYPFFQPANAEEKVKAAGFLQDTVKVRRELAEAAVYALGYASKELVHSCPAIWGIGYYAQVRCFLAALSIKLETAIDYPQELREEANKACDKVVDIARHMCEEKRWSFRLMSGTLVLFCENVADERKKALSPSMQDTGSDVTLSPQQTDVSSTSSQKPIRKPKRSREEYHHHPSHEIHSLSLDVQSAQNYDMRMHMAFQDQNEYISPVDPYANAYTPSFASAPMVDESFNMMPEGATNYPMMTSDGFGNMNSWDMGTMFQQDFNIFNWGTMEEFHDSNGVPKTQYP
ncbi:hypothetical protein TWF102_001582 [Orbilia oligospora]|uniref:Zn(2)-C6 fungal-type domain-containing protein n=1 Tax=Orbilia oligospora TaxID=2813651 RepID=A0A7C8NJ86_ORBOL|nr:hypothetical protein TWF102_001582 [Orbilia oligospora]KAF3088222.1 hypothetical protein TWF103_001214 [Orbilia oligospora]KAF3124775.1 hypothetical protein TWF594_001767 [Orbilia oligospora]KAF3125294.1 hypothetical protein TWF703_010998 [Orbilia oligospora]